MNILKFIAPKLKYAQIGQIHGYKEKLHLNVMIQFGRFKYLVRFSKQQLGACINFFVKQVKSVETLEISCFDQVTKQDWEKFFQVNRVTKFTFCPRNPRCENSFFSDYINCLPDTVQQVAVEFWYNIGKNKLLLIQEVFIFI